MRKIALFGGSFDPVQNGHVEFIRLLAARFDKTIVVPCRISPFKTEADIASAPDRKAMLALALGRLRDVEISDYELRAAGVSYTCRTLQYYRHKYPDAEFWIAVGSDMPDRLNDWREAAYLKENAGWFVTGREGFPMDGVAARRAEGYRIETSGVTFPDSSSARVKVDLAFGRTPDVPETVYGYIVRHGLYRKYADMTGRYPEFGMKQSRIEHTYRAVIAGIRLAKLHGADTDKAITALILHDIGKYADEAVLAAHGLAVPPGAETMPPAVRHAPVGALIAEKCFGITDGDILAAIRYHTTGRPGMSVLERVVYLADMIEPGRDFPGADALRKLAAEDLDAAMYEALKSSLAYVKACGGAIAPETAEACAFYEKSSEVNG